MLKVLTEKGVIRTPVTDRAAHAISQLITFLLCLTEPNAGKYSIITT